MRQWNKPKKESKYKNLSCRCKLGHQHDSVDEAWYCAKLQLELKGKLFKSFEYEKSFDLCVNGKKICGHKPDFLITNHDGSQEVREYKGFATKDWGLRRKLFEACYPDIPYFVKSKKDLL